MTSDVFLFKISDAWQSSVPWYYRLLLFIPLLVGAVYFSHKAHKIIFQEEREKLTVINTDVFARIRHPLYFSSIITYLAFVILSLSSIAFVIFIFVSMFYYYLCRYEEKILIEKLGNDYKNYMKNVPMLIPKIRI